MDALCSLILVDSTWSRLGDAGWEPTANAGVGAGLEYLSLVPSSGHPVAGVGERRVNSL